MKSLEAQPYKVNKTVIWALYLGRSSNRLGHMTVNHGIGVQVPDDPLCSRISKRSVVECQNVLLAEVSLKSLPLKFLTLLLLVKECFFEMAEHCVSSHGFRAEKSKKLKDVYEMWYMIFFSRCSFPPKGKKTVVCKRALSLFWCVIIKREPLWYAAAG